MNYFVCLLREDQEIWVFFRYEIRNAKFSYALESPLEVFKGRSETRLLEVINLP